jgi:YHS domain-containing protein
MFMNLKNGELSINTYRLPDALSVEQEDVIENFLGETGKTMTAIVSMTVEYEGKTYYLAQQAYCENYGTDGEVRYYADAVDENGEQYKVVWDTTVAWDNGNEVAAIEMKLKDRRYFTDEEVAKMEDRLKEIGDNYADIEDESGACDWDSPANVYKLGA